MILGSEDAGNMPAAGKQATTQLEKRETGDREG